MEHRVFDPQNACSERLEKDKQDIIYWLKKVRDHHAKIIESSNLNDNDYGMEVKVCMDINGDWFTRFGYGCLQDEAPFSGESILYSTTKDSELEGVYESLKQAVVDSIWA